MTIANWLTFMASVIALLAVIFSYRTNKKQLENANELALNQIRAAATETSRRLKAEILLKEKQAWIREFRETINELLFLGDPFLDGSSASLSTAARVEQMTRLAHKVDLMLPVGTTHAALAEKIVQFADLLADGSLVPMSKGQRLSLASQITILTREILRNELASVEANL